MSPTFVRLVFDGGITLVLAFVAVKARIEVQEWRKIAAEWGKP